MPVRLSAASGPLVALGIVLLAVLPVSPGLAAPLSAAARARLAVGQTVRVIVEFETAAVDRAADTERTRRRLLRDDATIKAARSTGYGRIKENVDATIRGPDARRVRDYSHLPTAVYQISSLAALGRLQGQSAVRAVHEDVALRVNSVSDLGLVRAAEAAANGATGAGTVVAVIDGGLGSNYLNIADFGGCTGVNTPASSCRVLYNHDYYSGTAASHEVTHGTNVAAIALGVAAAAKLAMYDVFTWVYDPQAAGYVSVAFSSDVNAAINHIVANANPTSYNIVAVNLSLGDGSSHSTQCGASNGPNSSVFRSAINSLSNAGIMTVAAAGNNGSKTGLGDPACIPGVVSVGAVYDAAYGTITWGATGGPCTDDSATDKVACFSQSAGYLSVLAPGSFVSAPSAAFQMSGTSQAAPHITGALAALRARYPAEPLSQTLQRLQDTGIPDTDPANGLTRSRLDLYAAQNEGTVVSLSGNGPTVGTAGGTATYTITVTNSGPLIATDVSVIATLPGSASFYSASSGCTYTAGIVTCNSGSLAVGANLTYTISVQWSSSGPVYSSAVLALDQRNSASTTQTQLAFGTPPSPADAAGDAPLPLWAYVLLAVGLFGAGVSNAVTATSRAGGN